MISMLNNLKYEFSLFMKSKHIFFLISYAILILFIYSLGQFAQLSSNLDTYNQDIIFMEENGYTEEEALTMDKEVNTVELENGNVLEIDKNPLISSKISIIMTLYSLSPYYYLENILEGATFVFFPIILSIYAIYITSLEYENKMIRIRSIRDNWGKIVLSKLFFTILVSIFFVLIISLLSILVSNIQMKFVNEEVIEKFMTEEYKINFNIFLNIGISMLVSIIFVSLSTFLTVICRKKFIPVILILVYLLIIPSLGMFDLKNILMNLTIRNFPYFGSSSIASVIELPELFCVTVCFILILLISFLTYITAIKQKKF